MFGDDNSTMPRPPLFGLQHYLAAMQIAQMLKASHYAEQDRQMRLEDRQRAMQQNDEQIARQHANDVIGMNDRGGKKVTSGPKADLIRSAIDDTHAQVTLPGSGQYELPTPDEEQASRVQTALKLRELTERPINVPEELQGIYGSKTANVPKEGALKTSADLYNLVNPAPQTHFSTDNNGDVHAIQYQKRKGVTGEQVVPGAGKPSRSPSGGKLTAGELQQQSRDAVLQSQFGGNQFTDNPDIAKAAQARVDSGKSANAQEAEWYIRNGNPNTIKLLYPQLFDQHGKLRDKIDVTQSPAYKEAYRRDLLKRTAENRAGAQSKGAQTAKPKSVPASKLAEAAKRNGISLNEARKRLAAQGVDIDEEN